MRRGFFNAPRTTQARLSRLISTSSACRSSKLRTVRTSASNNLARSEDFLLPSARMVFAMVSGGRHRSTVIVSVVSAAVSAEPIAAGGVAVAVAGCPSSQTRERPEL